MYPSGHDQQILPSETNKQSLSHQNKVGLGPPLVVLAWWKVTLEKKNINDNCSKKDKQQGPTV